MLLTSQKSWFQLLQDRDDIFINFAEFSKEHLQYLRGKPLNPKTFMKIYVIGPSEQIFVNEWNRLPPFFSH